MNKNEKNINEDITSSHDTNLLQNKVIEKSLDSQISFDEIDSSNAYYSERYGKKKKKN